MLTLLWLGLEFLAPDWRRESCFDLVLAPGLSLGGLGFFQETVPEFNPPSPGQQVQKGA